MRRFETDQTSFEIAGVHFGGQPGEWPTVMCGSIFYDGHKVVSDAVAGVFDMGAARELLNAEASLVEQFGLQRMPDVVGDTPQALIRYVEFVLELIDGPILVDSASIQTLLETFRHFRGSECLDRLVFSPIDVHTTEEQFAIIKECQVKNALLMAFSPNAVTPQQKMELLLGADGLPGNSLLAKAAAAGIERLLVDVGVIDLQGTAWSAMSIELAKQTLGLPTGCAPANALFSWQRTHSDVLSTSQQTAAAGAAVYSSTVYAGADFLLYGPMRCAEWAYPACAVADSLMAYGNRLQGIRPGDKSHPLYKLK